MNNKKYDGVSYGRRDFMERTSFGQNSPGSSNSQTRVPPALESLIEEHGKEGNVGEGSNSRIFVDEENKSVWKIVPQYNQREYANDQAVYSAAGIDTPTEMALDVDMSEYNLGSSLVVKQEMVDDYRSILEMPAEEAAQDLSSMARSVHEEGHSLDFDITNFGVNDDGEVVYVDDADPFSLAEPSIDKMMRQFEDSLDELDKEYQSLKNQVQAAL